MAKIASILILVGAFINIQGLPPSTFDDVIAAAKQNQWEQVQKMLQNNFATNSEFKPATFNSVRNLKPADGGHVYGEAEYSYHSASNVDGKTTEDHAGHKVINDDGKVKEFDFTPASTALPPVIAQLFNGVPNQQAQGGQNSFNHQYSYSNSYANGKPVGQGGQVINNGVNPLQHSLIAPLTFTGVRDLKPPQGGQVYGEAQYSYHTASNINGKTSEDQGGHKIINNNGQVQEFDFTPSLKSPVKSY